MNIKIIECPGYNASFYEELKFYYKEIKINDDSGMVFLIGERQKLFDALIKTYQQTLIVDKEYVLDFVYNKWPELKPY